jgi:hypothetical protein
MLLLHTNLTLLTEIWQIGLNLINDQYPAIQLLPGKISSGYFLQIIDINPLAYLAVIGYNIPLFLKEQITWR